MFFFKYAFIGKDSTLLLKIDVEGKTVIGKDSSIHLLAVFI